MYKLKLLLSLAIIGPALVFAPALVAAESSPGASGSGSGSNNKTTTTTTPASAPVTTKSTDDTTKQTDTTTKDPGIKEPNDADPTALKTRLELLKTGLKINLGLADKNRIIQKCKPAQTIVESTEKSDKDAASKRAEIYKTIDTNLKALDTKLKTAGADTTTFESELTVFEQKVATFNTDLNTYRQTLADLRAMDCKTDPAAFQAALTSARTQREKVRNDAVDIRTYLISTVKVTLQDLRIQLQKKEDAAKSTTTMGGNQ